MFSFRIEGLPSDTSESATVTVQCRSGNWMHSVVRHVFGPDFGLEKNRRSLKAQQAEARAWLQVFGSEFVAAVDRSRSNPPAAGSEDEQTLLSALRPDIARGLAEPRTIRFWFCPKKEEAELQKRVVIVLPSGAIAILVQHKGQPDEYDVVSLYIPREACRPEGTARWRRALWQQVHQRFAEVVGKMAKPRDAFELDDGHYNRVEYLTRQTWGFDANDGDVWKQHLVPDWTEPGVAAEAAPEVLELAPFRKQPKSPEGDAGHSRS